MSKANPLIVILGPTASGKTALAVDLAGRLDSEIISADSRQIFRGMDIGTGKDLHTYKVDGKSIPYHLIDIKNPGEPYHVDAYKIDFYKAYDALKKRCAWPILCGGTGMYIQAILQDSSYTQIPVNHALRAELILKEKSELLELLNQYPEKFIAHVDLSSAKRLIRGIEVAQYLALNDFKPLERPVFQAQIFGINPELQIRRNKIKERLVYRLNNGLIEEVQQLLNTGLEAEKLLFYGLEYKFVCQYLHGDFGLEILQERLYVAICQFAKRQMTYFRKMEKDGLKIHWLEPNDAVDKIIRYIL